MSGSRPLIDDVRSRLVSEGQSATAQNVYAALRSQHRVVDSVGLLSLVDEVRGDLDGLGPLEVWVSTPHVTDVLVNGPSDVWIDRGNGLERTTTRFRDEAALRRFIQRLTMAAGRRIDDASPYVDVELAGGVRMHAILPPLSCLPCVSLRVPRRSGFTFDEMVRSGAFTPEIAEALKELIRLRLSFLISGGTGCGKTTVLSTLLELVDARHRLVIVEDTSELRPDHQHVVRLQSRTANIEGAGCVTMRDLVRQALRMRPDRLVVGEARGAEVVDLMAALNTGHEGGCGTIHANSAADVPARVEALAAVGGLDRGSAHSQLASAVDAVVHVARRPDRTRFVQRIDVLDRRHSEWVEAVPVLIVDAEGRVESGAGTARWNRLTASVA